jgi:hypothetical protein
MQRPKQMKRCIDRMKGKNPVAGAYSLRNAFAI